MAKGKKKNSNKSQNNAPSGKKEYIDSLVNKEHKISAEEFKQFQALKAAVAENGDFNYDAYVAEATKIADEEVAEAKKAKLDEIDNITSSENEELINTNKELIELRNRVQGEVDDLNAKKVGLSGEVDKIIGDATAKADKITSDATTKAQKITDDATNEAKVITAKANKDADAMLETREKALKAGEDKLAIDQDELEDGLRQLERYKARLDHQKERLVKKEEEYHDSNPEALEKLRVEIENKEKFIADISKEFQDLNDAYRNLRLLKTVVGDKSAEELFAENKQMQELIEELTNKCNRFTDFELSEMQKAYDEKPLLEEKIAALEITVREDKAKMQRFENSERELENIRARVDLITTLNDHLARELKNSKKALESRDGNVCPQLMEVDIESESEETQKIFKERQQFAKNIGSFTLPQIIQHVKDYAETQDLYYKDNDLRAFVAGLASSRIAVLQGLSGTGKTTLPRIFAEALFTENHRVEVQSSWRDRNELIGYYNDFNKKFTARKFTRFLYQAGLEEYKGTPYFIVLDEMNISRVEYYFADFLSLLEETDTSKWELYLTETDLRSLPSELSKEQIAILKNCNDDEVDEILDRGYDEKGKLKDLDDEEKMKLLNLIESAKQNYYEMEDFASGPKNLVDGKILKFPQNVWFIGTANRDESTFEISDKVYDRAQVMNFMPAEKPITRCAPVRDKKYISNQYLLGLFEQAKNDYSFDYSTNSKIRDIETCLSEEFDVAFGNRMGKQIDTFVSVYVAAGQGVKSDKELELEAIDYQIANKVLRKIEYKDATDTDRYELLLSCLEGLPMSAKIVKKKLKEH